MQLINNIKTLNYNGEKKIKMDRRCKFWLMKEDKTLKDLRITQMSKNTVSWNKIRDLMNLTFKTKKTSKQCRERYISFLKFEEETETIYEWSN